MQFSISTSDIKRKSMIADAITTYDSSISSLITEMQPALEYLIDSAYLLDTSNSGLQAVLKLGILEILAGEFICQMIREEGKLESFSAGGIVIGESKLDGAGLILQGNQRLLPYLKSNLPTSASLSSASADDYQFAEQENIW